MEERQIRKVVVLGANGAMGSGGGEVFAAAGIETVFLARDQDKAEEGRQRAESLAKAEAISKCIRTGSYDDLSREVTDADLVFEAVAEDLALKKEYFEVVDAHRKPGSIVSTVSSGLSIARMSEGRSADFRKNFLGIHLFNPPNVIVGCEVVPHEGTDPAVVEFVSRFLENGLGREVVETRDLPAFAGNRVGFKVLNEVAQLAEEHGVAFMDMLIGPQTGRAMPPLATIDLVGWDVHRAIVDNLYENTDDEAHETFALPGWMAKLMEAGHLGNKTPEKGGFFRHVKEGKTSATFVLDPKTGGYVPAAEVEPTPPDFVVQMRRLHHRGKYREAMRILLEAPGPEGDLLRRVILGYISYGLNRVGEVVHEARDVDRIMAFGFNWAPPSVLVDLMGVEDTIAAIERAGLAVPKVLGKASGSQERLFREPHVGIGRFFVGQA